MGVVVRAIMLDFIMCPVIWIRRRVLDKSRCCDSLTFKQVFKLLGVSSEGYVMHLLLSAFVLPLKRDCMVGVRTTSAVCVEIIFFKWPGVAHPNKTQCNLNYFCQCYSKS